MTTPEQRVIEANVVIKKRHCADPSASRAATITVTPGKIEVVSIEAKFPPIRVNTEALVKFKRPRAKSINWASLNFIQNIEAKLNYVNIQVELSRRDELFDVLEFAWKSKPAVDVFADNTDEICVPKRTAAPRNRVTRMDVDEEGSAAFSDFSNNFAARRAPLKADAIQALFDVDKNGSTRSVVSNPKTTSTLSSLLRSGEEAQHSAREERKAMAPPSQPTSSIWKRMATKDSLDAERRVGRGVTMTPGTFSPAAAQEFDNLFRKKSSNTNLSTNNNPPFRPSLQSSLRDREEDEDDEKLIAGMLFAAPNNRSDVILKIGEKKLHVSKQLLAAHSSFFDKLFFGDFAEQGKKEVEIKDVVYEEFIDLLNIIYLVAQITERSVPHILKLADRFQMERLVAQSTKFLAESKGIDVMKKLLIADQCNMPSLKDQCLQSVTNSHDWNAKLKSPEFNQLSGDMKIAICDRMAEL